MGLFNKKKSDSTSSHSNTTCQQCGGPPIVDFNGHLLCLSCYERVHRLEQNKLHDLFILHNRAAESLEHALGWGGQVARYRVPTPNIVNANVNDIKINNSNVGSVNTGSIDNLNVSLKIIDSTNYSEIANNVKIFIESTLASELPIDTKNEVIELVDTIMSEVTSTKNIRKPSVIKALTNSVKDIITVNNGLFTLWDNIQKTINSMF